MAETRTPELIRREIALEREGLARALEQLRLEATSAGRRVRSRLRVLPAALAAAVVVLAGLLPAARALVRRLRG